MQQPDPSRLLGSKLKELASDVHLAELLRAVRKDIAGPDVQRWVARCSSSALSNRCAGHAKGLGPFALCAPPLWLACYRSDHATALALLRHRHNSDDNQLDVDVVCRRCPGRGHACDCTIGGQSVLHVAVARGAPDNVSILLRAGADASAPCCFACDEADEPEWDEDVGAFGDGLVGLSALQLAALRSDDALCTLLLSHGADPKTLQQLPAGASLPPALAPQLAPMLGTDGEALECPICMEGLVKLSSVWTPCCLRPFHAHCLRGLSACPMCRAKLRDAPSEPEGDAQLAGALAAADAVDTAASTRRPHNSLRSTRNHERALELAFGGAHWGPDQPQSSGMGSFNAAMGTNFGWRARSYGPV